MSMTGQADETSRGEPLIREVFSKALQIRPGEQCDRYLEEICTGNPELRRQVDSLLNAHRRSRGWLTDLGENDRAFAPGQRIGRYRLLRQLGEGGFSRVFLAEQTEPVKRQVALKLLKAGMDTQEVVTRFRAEQGGAPTLVSEVDAVPGGSAEGQRVRTQRKARHSILCPGEGGGAEKSPTNRENEVRSGHGRYLAAWPGSAVNVRLQS